LEEEGSAIWILLIAKVDLLKERGEPGRLTMNDGAGIFLKMRLTPGSPALRSEVV
jgi:hypothetical protein